MFVYGFMKESKREKKGEGKNEKERRGGERERVCV